MHSIKRHYLALALSAALTALPVSMAAAEPADGNGTDGSSGPPGQSGETSSNDQFSSDDTWFGPVTPDDDYSSDYDRNPDSKSGDDSTIPCSQYDPCGLNEA
jgi:hypothetical protein